MENSFDIIKLSPTRWLEYKMLRLESLNTEPTAFLGTIQEESFYEDGIWQERLKNAQLPDDNLMLFAEKNGNIVGMIGILFNKNQKIKHIAYLVSFYVTPSQRRKGIGKALVSNALKAIKERGYVIKISLDVTITQEGTIKLYESFNFKKIALLKNNIKVDDIYYDEYLMENYV